jgi:membrane-bound lytic murein transglycosylase A
MTAGARRFHRKAGRTAVTAAMLHAAVLLVMATPAQAVKIGNSNYEAMDWARIDGWVDDDHAAGFATFMQSCRAILRSSPDARKGRPIFRGLHEACTVAATLTPKDARQAREFFEQNFRPVRITPAGEPAGFVTGYYEPVVEGSREPTGEFVHPLYRTPPGLLRGGKRLKAASFKRGKKSVAANIAKGAKATKSSPKAAAKKAVAIVRTAKASKKKKRGGGRRLVSFYDRAAIEDGVLKGRNLEIVYLKDPVDSFFIQIQGSARVRLTDGTLMRVNYDSQNGHPYYAVGRWLVDNKIFTKEEMSMDRIRKWMTENPEGGKELRRMNKSYVFFRETGLAENEEPVGAQGVSLTAGRSIAVDRNLHVYGTPFFIQAELPIDSEDPTTRWRRLMVAQDTGGAIIGPARADIYYGAGEPAGLISGRFKQPGQFVMLFPKSVDPFAKSRNDDDDIPLPRPRPGSAPQDDALPPAHGAPGEQPKPELVAATQADVPLPPARPEIKPTKTANVKPADKPAPAKSAVAKPADAAKPAAKKPAKGDPKKRATPKAVEPTPPG